MKDFFKKNIKKILILTPLILTTLLIFLFTIKPYQRSIIIEDSSSKEKISLKTGDKYTSEIKIKNNNIKGLEIYNSDMSYYFYATSKPLLMNVKIYVDDELFYKEGFTKLKQNNSMLLFNKPLKNCKDKKIKIELEVEKAEENIILLQNKDGNLRTNQISTENDFRILIYIFIIFIIFALLLTIKLVKYNKIKLFNNKIFKFIHVPLYFIINIAFAFLCLYLAYIAHYVKSVPITLISIEIILIFSIIFIGTYIFKSGNGKVEKWFLAIAVPISFMFCALLLPNDGQDGYRHYGTAYGYATGQKVSAAIGEIPNVILTKKYSIENLRQFFEILNADYDYKETKTVNIPNYNFLGYLISIPAIAFAKIINVHPYMGWYIAKIANTIFAIIAGYFIVKRVPKYKKLFMTYILMPGFIYQYVCLSTDLIINIATLGLISIGLDYYYNQRQVKNKDWILIIILTILMIIAKPIYYPFILIVLFLMRKSLKSSKRKISIIVTSLIIPLIIYIGWRMYCNSQIPTAETIESLNATSISFKYLLMHPLQGIMGFIKQLISESDQYILNFVGWRFNWAGGNTEFLFSALYLFILLFSALIPNYKNDKKLDITTVIITMIITFGVLALMILYWMYCEIQSNIFINKIYGLSGRYCIPIFIFFLLTLSNVEILKDTKEYIKKYDKFLIISICFMATLYINRFIELLFT